MLKPEQRETRPGRGRGPRRRSACRSSGSIAGCYVRTGAIKRNARAPARPRRRWSSTTARSASLRRFKDDVGEVRDGLRVRHRPRELPGRQGRRHHRGLRGRRGRPQHLAAVVVALERFDLRIPGARSLKQKRHVVKGLTAALRQAFPVSVAEVDHQDLWQRAPSPSPRSAPISTTSSRDAGVGKRVERWAEVEVIDSRAAAPVARRRVATRPRRYPGSCHKDRAQTASARVSARSSPSRSSS